MRHRTNDFGQVQSLEQSPSACVSRQKPKMVEGEQDLSPGWGAQKGRGEPLTQPHLFNTIFLKAGFMN